MKIAARMAALASAAALFASVGVACNAAGRNIELQDTATQGAPTPYPARAEDWQGSGVICVFGWMKDNRDFFWSERDIKRGSIVFAGDS